MLFLQFDPPLGRHSTPVSDTIRFAREWSSKRRLSIALNDAFHGSLSSSAIRFDRYQVDMQLTYVPAPKKKKPQRTMKILRPNPQSPLIPLVRQYEGP